MNNKSRVVFEGYGYTASIAGFKAENGPFLSVTRKNCGGKYLSGTDAIVWAAGIEDSIDPKEAAALCKAVYNA